MHGVPASPIRTVDLCRGGDVPSAVPYVLMYGILSFMNTVFPRPEYLNEPHVFLFFGFFLGCIFLLCFNELVVYRTDRSGDAVWYSGFFISPFYP